MQRTDCCVPEGPNGKMIINPIHKKEFDTLISNHKQSKYAEDSEFWTDCMAFSAYF